MDQKSGNFETIDFFLQEGLENYGGSFSEFHRILVTKKFNAEKVN